jgi:acyl carrier protein phosphodiesterase
MKNSEGFKCMNYLAHLYLAQDSAELMIGSILGDFVKGRLKDRYPNEIQHGIALHRKIDSYTDSHVVTQASRQLETNFLTFFPDVICFVKDDLAIQSQCRP